MKHETAQTTIRIPTAIYEAARECAAEVGISFNAFNAEALAQRVKNWKSPLTGRSTAQSAKTRGKWCIICNVAAKGCKAPDHHQAKLWRKE